VAFQRETWNRQELYEKVWQFPLRKLATEYGISDVGLAKVCRKLDIPLPGLGHWTLAHPLVEKMRLVLSQSSSRPGERLSASRELEWLDLRVTKNYLPRTLGIMAALIQMLEQEGFQVVVEKKATESTRAVS
jgi:hypothetical protein